MLVGQFCHHTPSGGALDETLHDEEGLVDLLDGACILTNGGGNGGDAHRTALELVDDGEQDLVVDLVETILVDVQGREGYLRNLGVNLSVAFHLGEISHTAQQGVGDTGRTSGTACDL